MRVVHRALVALVATAVLSPGQPAGAAPFLVVQGESASSWSCSGTAVASFNGTQTLKLPAGDCSATYAGNGLVETATFFLPSGGVQCGTLTIFGATMASAAFCSTGGSTPIVAGFAPGVLVQGSFAVMWSPASGAGDLYLDKLDGYGL